MAKYEITADKIAQFQRATCTTGNRELAVAYLEAEEGLLDGAIESYRADGRAYAAKTAAIRKAVIDEYGAAVAARAAAAVVVGGSPLLDAAKAREKQARAALDDFADIKPPKVPVGPGPSRNTARTYLDQ